jgi:DNA-directed RNA polymerase specialized sigma24 family protein
MAAFKFSVNTPAEREKLFIALYKNTFPAVAKYVSKMGGDLDEAKDVFQDALLIYYEKIAGTNIALRTNEKAYLLGIAKHLWAKKFRDDLHYVPMNDLYHDTALAEDEYAEPSVTSLMQYLETAGQKCMNMLKAFYYDKLPVNAIAELFGYSGVRSATVQKYKCLEKVRETIKERSLTYEDFVN